MKFKETKAYKAIKELLQGAWDVVNLPERLFDTNKDGKITFKDFKKMEWWKIVGALATLAALLYFGILSFDQVLEWIKDLNGG